MVLEVVRDEFFFHLTKNPGSGECFGYLEMLLKWVGPSFAAVWFGVH
jgi:hypothetical protein